ncbi:MAG: HK97 family phage prohead protease [Oscillospiraceae bacterium]|nr:HK97 family phage prohead protease [Oscillospiraceae bacterium]MBQ8996403.1 HK97 family phage prohead protease [Oscillospiraceae bacterium]
MNREERQTRTASSKFETRESGEDLYIEGYFSVFNSVYEMWDGATESVDPHAFDNTINGDIRCLINHNSSLVLGRTKSGTLELKIDNYGLWGRVKINPNDQDAVNLYERVKRGDVDQCSFGFEIISEETEWNEDDSIHWTLTEVRLFEVSVVTFPAYEDTSVSARQKDFEEMRQRRKEARAQKMREELTKKLKGDAQNGAQDPYASQKDN